MFDNIRLSECRYTPGKQAFKKRRQAESAATTAARRYDGPTRVYQCDGCGMWHITTKNPDGTLIVRR